MKEKRKKRIIKLLVALIVIFSIILVLGFMDYLPLFTRTQEPVESIGKIDIESYIEETPDLSGMPNLDKINYEGWYSSASEVEIVDEYTTKLQDQGYSFEYNGYASLNGKQYRVIGFLKGLTAAGIMIYSAEGLDSEVIYATGNALDFMDIIDWYRNN